ncbi:hypothetical protein BD779DRAFT_23979 [Infundibulicybe gibba]|nr:hypothetical protein BD779DRAFT_23979 [Infundibulicybe gibba]
MTAILPATDALRRDRHMSLDDNHISYSSSSTDWHAKYNEVADMLAETRAELDDFHHASKELEAELENELQRTEKSQQELKVKVARAETERDDWKSKFMSLQTTYNTTTTSLQRELDKLRQEHQQVKIQLRELEMGNDDLERNERAVSSSLADMESKYSRALEEKILLEHELLEKASLEEESQRLRDELRDANVEISILKDQVTTRSKISSTSETPHIPSTRFPEISISSSDNLLMTPPPPDLHLSELSPSSDSLSSDNSATPKRPVSSFLGGQSALLQRAGFQPNKSSLSTPPGSTSGIARSNTLPTLNSPTSSSPRTPTMRPHVARNVSTASTTSTTSTVSKNKGVQMVSEMRARVRNLEQKIHTRVPRLRMVSITGRANNHNLAMSTINTGISRSTASPSSRSSSTAKTSWDSLTSTQRRSNDSKRSTDSEPDKKRNQGDSSGWVLIMEDSPSPPKDRRRTSSPPTAFRPAASVANPSPTFGSNKPINANHGTGNTGMRRPQSRLSGGSLSTATTSSSIPTPISRPTTPTFLPVPSGGLYAHSTTAGVTGLKRSTGPGGPSPYAQTKRSSLGASTAAMPPPDRRDRLHTISPPPSRPNSGTPSSASSKYSFENTKHLPQLPGLHTNITMRGSSKVPTSASSSTLAQSRIGRPTSAGLSGRRSVGDSDIGGLDAKKDPRQRAGSSVFGNRVS